MHEDNNLCVCLASPSNLDSILLLIESLQRFHRDLLRQPDAPIANQISQAERRIGIGQILNKEKNGAVLLAKYSDGKMPVGVAVIHFSPGKAIISDLFVAEGERGKGIGHTLIAQVRNIAAGRKLPIVSLGVMSSNHEAVKFYLRNGFKEKHRMIYLESPTNR